MGFVDVGSVKAVADIAHTVGDNDSLHSLSRISFISGCIITGAQLSCCVL